MLPTMVPAGPSATPAAVAALLPRRTRVGPQRPPVRARRFVGCPYLDVGLLAADELVVNALRHTKSGQDGGCCTVEIARDGGLLAVSVVDQGGPGEPAADAGELAESGRGLRTVSLTTASWGWHGNDEGRTVTAIFAGEWAA
ncbi:ATP-binding protein [Spirillospora sp. CA-128828]|uniref:ATP-binding protein n=1 Tax=Spirillospora sp. CA-128828 TaxID=3240033 RepID=UPI003D8CDF4A